MNVTKQETAAQSAWGKKGRGCGHQDRQAADVPARVAALPARAPLAGLSPSSPASFPSNPRPRAFFCRVASLHLSLLRPRLLALRAQGRPCLALHLPHCCASPRIRIPSLHFPLLRSSSLGAAWTPAAARLHLHLPVGAMDRASGPGVCAAAGALLPLLLLRPL